MDLLADLNEPQRQAVTHVDGPLLVLAGAGSGKTRVIARRAAYLIQQGVPAWNVLAITFTNKAAGEMRQRVEQSDTPRGATICTFHSLCARLLREFAGEAELAANYSIYDQADQIKLVKEAMTRLDLPTANLSPAAVHATISNAKNELKGPEEFARQSPDTFYERNVAAVYREYQRMLAANNALDFDDLLLRTALLMRDRPEVRELLSRRYRYVMIDEYQDTNHAQYIIAHGIAMDHENVCATGDPDQSIYGWRGANIRNILEFEGDYPNATVIRLEENYRSTAPILAAASRLIAQNSMRKEKALWTRRSGGPKPRVVYCDDERAEAGLVARRLAEIRRADGNCDDVAVFYRVNALSRVLEEALLTGGIPYRVARGVEFYNRKEIKDVLAYLKLLANPDDDVSCLRIINTPARGIGPTTVKRLSAFAESKGHSLLNACGQAAESGLSAAAAQKVGAFAALIDSLSSNLSRPVRDVVEDMVRRSGMEEALEGKAEESRQARANVAELVSTAAEFDESVEGATLVDYLHRVSLVSDVDRFEGGGAVTLMTLHAAKGLEFPVVFMIGCEDGLLPFRRLQEDPGRRGSAIRDIEEERRLAFVGMTRAKDELTLTCARQRMLRGRREPQAASRFLAEIGAENVEVRDLTTPQPRIARSAAAGGFYADAAERALIEAMQEQTPMPPEYQYLHEGSAVLHPKFGRGKILRLRQKWPETRADVFFDEYGPKTLVLARTTLELIDEE